MPIGSVFSASASKMMLAVIAASVSTDGTSRVNPSVYFRPTAQPTSIKPATNRMYQAMKGPLTR